MSRSIGLVSLGGQWVCLNEGCVLSPQKATLLADALALLGDRVFNRGVEAIGALEPNPLPRELLRALMLTGVPSDSERQEESLLFFSFYIAAMTDPEYADEAARQSLEWTFPFATEVIQSGVASGHTRPGIEPEPEALILMSAFYGLCLGVLSGSLTASEAVVALDYQLDRIFY